MSKSLIVACDGEAASGKSTGAKLLSKKYKLLLLNSGLLYRYASKILITKKPKKPIPYLKKIFKRTSYNTSGGIHKNDQSKSFRKNFAGVGYTYDKNRDAFIPPKQYKSWTLDEETCWWIPPIPFPEDGTKTYEWDEEAQAWNEIKNNIEE